MSKCGRPSPNISPVMDRSRVHLASYLEPVKKKSISKNVVKCLNNTTKPRNITFKTREIREKEKILKFNKQANLQTGDRVGLTVLFVMLVQEIEYHSCN